MAGSNHIRELEDRIVEELRQIFDPEIPVNIYDLGLIYGIDIESSGKATITMTLTAPNCPVAETLPVDIKEAVERVRGITQAEVILTFDPPWNKDMLSDEAMLELGLL
ncbi:MAG: iron-sulfur cluster assembly protein [Bacteroidales bacterium]|nr:iron-sulfur cluster assembly protein [Bacteroidales bacterium]MDZ4205054.1 iron-sulfur cluster assembly protein [Bacteroidales bacterium]